MHGPTTKGLTTVLSLSSHDRAPPPDYVHRCILMSIFSSAAETMVDSRLGNELSCSPVSTNYISMCGIQIGQLISAARTENQTNSVQELVQNEEMWGSCMRRSIFVPDYLPECVRRLCESSLKPNSVENFVQNGKMRGIGHAQIDFRTGMSSSSPSVVFAKALYYTVMLATFQ